ncbi:uncharacterized, partial [Tachysurus ichikawai]
GLDQTERNTHTPHADTPVNLTVASHITGIQYLEHLDTKIESIAGYQEEILDRGEVRVSTPVAYVQESTFCKEKKTQNRALSWTWSEEIHAESSAEGSGMEEPLVTLRSRDVFSITSTLAPETRT